MLLKRLELSGFKSFASKAVFEFEPGISILVGPNGSGKSNVADAVRWVLGEQSARALRGKKAEEVIFAGSTERHPVGMAEVALVLDNLDRRLPVDFAEVRLARRLYRSGESDYLINGSKARRKDLVALLLEVGLHTQGYTVIGQGAVEELVMQRPDERRAVLEHAADITRHQARLADARGKLAATEQNLVRCKDLIAELEPHARRLRIQAEKAERYVARRAELAALARAYYRGALAEHEAADARADRLVSEATASCERLTQAIASLERDRQDRRAQLADLEDQQAKLQAERESLQLERDTLLASLLGGRERIGFLEARSETLAAEQERSAQRIDELATLQASSEAETSVDEAEHDRSALRDIEQQVEKLANDIQRVRQALENTRAQQAQMQHQRDILEGELGAERERQRRQQESQIEAATRRQALEVGLAEVARQRESAQVGLAASQEQAASADARLAESRRGLASVRGETAALREREQVCRGELEVARAALAQVREEAQPPGRTNGKRYESLGASLSVPAKYEAGVAAALGEWAEAELVDNSSQLKAALDRANGRRALFYIVEADLADSRNGRTAGGAFKHQASAVLGDLWHRFVADVIREEDPAATPAPHGMLGSTIIVSDLDSARIAADRLSTVADAPWQVATLEGEVIAHHGGAARGADSAGQRLLSLRRRERTAEAKARELEERWRADLAAREASEARLAELEGAERESQAATHAARAEVASLARRLEELRNEEARLARSLGELPEQTRVDQQATGNEQLSAREQQILERATRLQGEESAAATALSELQADWEQALSVRAAIRGRVEQVDSELRLRRREAELRLSEIERLRQQRQQAAEQASAASGELAALRDRLAAADAQAVELAEAAAEAARMTDRLHSQRAAQLQAIEAIEQVVANRRAELSGAQSARESALLARQQAADELARLRAEAEATAEEWGLAGASFVQLRMIGGPPGGAFVADQLSDDVWIDLLGARRRLIALQRELRGYGAIGESVLDEFHEVDERVRFLSAQSADLLAAREEIDEVIFELETIMRGSFGAAFERVNEAFKKSFATLFGGGTAYLELTNPGDPLQTGVEIVAQPPGKRLQNLMSLSGGERAFTSTALIFALLSINPLPFCVLDEVDAALDETNARRFAALLQEYAQRTQFVIITHNRVTMEIAQTLYGISMGGDGVTSVVSLRPTDALAHSRNGQAAHGA